MSNRTFNRIALGIVVVAALFTVGRCYDKRQSEWEARVERVQEQARHQRQQAEQARAEADSLSLEAENALRRAERAEASIRVRIDTVRAETPPDLREHPAIVRRDSIIDEQSAIITQVRRSFELEREASGRLRAALDAALARGDSLAAVLEDRPGDRPWWLPRVGLGAAAGLDTQGRPNTVAGLTVSWEIDFN